jgi:hypothetical protein
MEPLSRAGVMSQEGGGGEEEDAGGCAWRGLLVVEDEMR